MSSIWPADQRQSSEQDDAVARCRRACALLLARNEYLYAFLLSERAAYMTGATINQDGGTHYF